MQTEHETKNNPAAMNVLSLAYLGDSVWELFVREKVINTVHSNHADLLHKQGVKYVNANAQAKAVKAMIDEGFLSEAEVALVKRARNHRTATKSKNADAITYKWATAFESLLGYLHLADKERLAAVMNRAAEIIKA